MSHNPGSGEKKKGHFRYIKINIGKDCPVLFSVYMLNEWIKASIILLTISYIFSYYQTLSLMPSPSPKEQAMVPIIRTFPCTIVLDHPVYFSFWGSHHTTQRGKVDYCAWSQDPPPQQAAEVIAPWRRPEGLTRIFTTQVPWIRASSTTVCKLSSLLRRTVSSL